LPAGGLAGFADRQVVRRAPVSQMISTLIMLAV